MHGANLGEHGSEPARGVTEGRGPALATRCRKPDKGNYRTLDAFDQYELKFQNNVLGSKGVPIQPVAILVPKKSWFWHCSWERVTASSGSEASAHLSRLLCSHPRSSVWATRQQNLGGRSESRESLHVGAVKTSIGLILSSDRPSPEAPHPATC